MRVYKKICDHGGYGYELRCALNAIENGQGIKIDAHAFNVPPKALRRHRDKQAKTPGHSHLGELPVFISSFKCDLMSHIPKM